MIQNKNQGFGIFRRPCFFELCTKKRPCVLIVRRILDAIQEYAGVDVKGMDEAQLRETCKKLNVEVTPEMGVGKLIDAIFGGGMAGT